MERLRRLGFTEWGAYFNVKRTTIHAFSIGTFVLLIFKRHPSNLRSVSVSTNVFALPTFGLNVKDCGLTSLAGATIFLHQVLGKMVENYPTRRHFSNTSL